MPVKTEMKPPSVQQRSANATARLRAALGVTDAAPATLKLLSAAVAEAAADEMEINSAFAGRVRTAYDSIVNLNASKPVKHQQPEPVELVPIASYDINSYDPYAPPDPYFLNRIYGPHQLATALGRYTLPRLKQALSMVEERNPSTKPKNRSQKDAIIRYIVEQVAGPGY